MTAIAIGAGFAFVCGLLAGLDPGLAAVAAVMGAVAGAYLSDMTRQ